MTRHRFFAASASSLLLLMVSSSSGAGDGAPPSCASVPDDTARLACYDRMFGGPTGATVAEASPAPNKHQDPQFGLSARAIERAARDATNAPAPPTSISDAVTKLQFLRDGKFVATLANGQVWAQAEFESQALVAVGDTVTVKRGALGSYLLVTKDGVATRAKRLR
jgi:hypothetical protein